MYSEYINMKLKEVNKSIFILYFTIHYLHPFHSWRLLKVKNRENVIQFQYLASYSKPTFFYTLEWRWKKGGQTNSSNNGKTKENEHNLINFNIICLKRRPAFKCGSYLCKVIIFFVISVWVVAIIIIMRKG